MNDPMTTHEVLASLPSREADELRKHIGLHDEREQTTTPLPPGNDEANGLGEAPAPAKSPP